MYVAEVGHAFVKKQKLRMKSKLTGQHHALQLPSRKLQRGGIPEVFKVKFAKEVRGDRRQCCETGRSQTNFLSDRDFQWLRTLGDINGLKGAGGLLQMFKAGEGP